MLRVRVPRRACVAARAGAAGGRAPPTPAGASRPPTEETRDAVWELAGPTRAADRLERLLGDPYPLARLIAASALAREESRGVHRREDRPRVDPALAGTHVVVGAGGEPRLERWSNAERDAEYRLTRT